MNFLVRTLQYLKKQRFIFFAHKKLKKLQVALSQKRLENFFIARINIPNHYPEQKI